MTLTHNRFSGFAAALLLSGACASVALADDTEIFVGQGGTEAKPNILFIVDTSGSMDTRITTQVAYDPATTYAGSCGANRIYWRRDSGNPPTCGSTQWFTRSNLKCNAAVNALAGGGTYVADRAAQWSTGNNRWQQITAGTSTQFVECRGDFGIHGDGVDTTKLWPRDGDGANKWTSNKNSATVVDWVRNNTDRTYTFYDTNWLNWYYDPSTTTTRTRLEIVQEVADNLANSISGVNLGLMRYSNNGGGGDSVAEGGMVVHEIADIETSRTAITNTIDNFFPNGFTPMSETQYESYLYFAGGNVDYGLNSKDGNGNSQPSVAASRVTGNQAKYKSPIQFQCQKNYVVFLTDGLPTADVGGNGKIQTAIGATCDGTGDGACLDDLAGYMFDHDLRTDMVGKQNVTSYYIGFGDDISGDFLDVAAARGGGAAYLAGDTASLTVTLSNIVSQILQTSNTFVAPSVSVNAFNRTELLSDIYVAVFGTSVDLRWPGNVKKYQLIGGEIQDADGAPAVDEATGFFRTTARSVWSATTDGSDVSAGGAAHRLPADSTTRNIYTYLGNVDLTNTVNAFKTTNTSLTAGTFGLGSPGMPTVPELINWTRGVDVADDDNDGDVTEARFQMGDPVHAKPAVVIYGGTPGSPDVTDAVVYSPSNDGMLHAIDTVSGDELWSFIPTDVMGNLVKLYQNEPMGTLNPKVYMLDGDVRTLRIDNNGDGIIAPAAGDKVYLYFGQRRGGSNYYAIDVTNKLSPRVLFTLGPAQLPGLGQTWSTPAVAKVNVGGASQNAQKYVLIIGGGYDTAEDAPGNISDAVGNAIYFVDAVTGTRLWYASRTGANLNLTKMDHSIPAAVVPIDLDNDGLADRMYASDAGARIWRFDIFNGQTVGNLVTGGVLASLGNADLVTKPLADNRRFYQAPDVALIKRRGASPYYNIAIGSGYRGHPLDPNIRDRFYSIRDYSAFESKTQAQATAFVPVTDVLLTDITATVAPSLPPTALGWKLTMNVEGWVGEKVLAESRTFNNVIFFPSYTPSAGLSVDPCTPRLGTNRFYAISVFDGAPALSTDDDGSGSSADNNHDGTVDGRDRYTDLAQTGIAPEVVFFPGSDTSGSGNPNCPANNPNCDCPVGEPNCHDDDHTPGKCAIGVELVSGGPCAPWRTPVRTFWRTQSSQ